MRCKELILFVLLQQGYKAVTITNCVQETGSCVKADGSDQLVGRTKLADVSVDMPAECLALCIAVPGATGCELSEASCYAYTQTVDRGNSVATQNCWVMSKCKRVVDIDFVVGVQGTMHAGVGEEVKLWCDHGNDGTGANPVITWYKDNVQIETQGEITYKFTPTDISNTHDGVYKCAAAFTSGVVEGATTLKFSVREITASTTYYPVRSTNNFDIPCVAGGESPTSVGWVEEDGFTPQSFSETIIKVDVPYDPETREMQSTIRFTSNVIATQFYCKVTYADSSYVISDHAVSPLGTTGMTMDPAGVIFTDWEVTAVNIEAQVRVTCTYTFNLNTNSKPTITWELDDSDFTTAMNANVNDAVPDVGNVASQVYFIAEATKDDSGVYSCSAHYGPVKEKLETHLKKALTVRDININSHLCEAIFGSRVKRIAEPPLLGATSVDCNAGEEPNCSCDTCSESYYSTAGDDCVSCGGTDIYTLSTGSTAASDCIYRPCSAGEYMTGGGCVDCDANQYSDYDSESCSPCGERKTSSAGSGSCTWIPCSAGDYLHNTNGCTQCGANEWSADEANICEECISGKQSSAGSTSITACTWTPCNAGYYLDDSTGCEECAANTWSEAATEDSCTDCTGSKVSLAGATAVEHCKDPITITATPASGLVNEGTPITLDCIYESGSGLTITWFLDGSSVVNNGNDEEQLIMSGVSYASTGDWVCKVAYPSVGLHVGSPQEVFVQGISALSQTNMAGSRNDVGETITMTAMLNAQVNPSSAQIYIDNDEQGSVVPQYDEPEGEFEHPFTFELPNIQKPAEGNTLVIKVVMAADETLANSESDVDIDVYARCRLPTIDNIPKLSGAVVDHLNTLTDITCDPDYFINGGTRVDCADGENNYILGTTEEPVEPVCSGFLIADQIVQVDERVAIACETEETVFIIFEIVWHDETDSVVFTDDSPTVTVGSTEEYNLYKSQYYVTGAEELNGKRYTCTANAVNPNEAQITSVEATLYVVGFKESRTDGYPGDYIESNKEEGDLSEDYTITYEVYVGPGISSLAVTFTNTDGTQSAVNFIPGSQTGNIHPYTYSPPEAEKETGDFEITVVYTDFTDRTSYTKVERVFVFQFCQTSALPEISDGSWITQPDAPLINYKEYIPFVCDDGFYVGGSRVADCFTDNGVFVIDPTLTCHDRSDMPCGEFPATDHGYITYLTPTTAKYACNRGYKLLYYDEDYTCNVLSSMWSALTISTPYLITPACQAVQTAYARDVHIYIEMDVSVPYCNNELEDNNVKEAMEDYLKGVGLADCLANLECKIIIFTCQWNGDNSKIEIDLTLRQVFDLQYANVIDTAFDSITAIQNNPGTITFDLTVIDISRKRSAHGLTKRSTITATATLVQTALDTSCPDETLSQGGSCVECPIGYGVYEDICQICPIGSYSSEQGLEPCVACPSGETTKFVGSNETCDCHVVPILCTIKTGNSHSIINPPEGSSVEPNVIATMYCEEGYGLAHDIGSRFQCSDEWYPECYRLCSLETYTEAELERRNIHNDLSKTFLRHNETITVSCETYYAFEHDDTPSKTIQCHGDESAEHATVDFGHCTQKFSMTTLWVLIALVILLALIVVILCVLQLKGGRKRKDRKVRQGKIGSPDDNFYGNPSNNITAL